jgi:hypothetical protein
VRPLVIFVCALAVAAIGWTAWTAWTANETANLVSRYVEHSAFLEAVGAYEEAEQVAGAPFKYRKQNLKEYSGCLVKAETLTEEWYLRLCSAPMVSILVITLSANEQRYGYRTGWGRVDRRGDLPRNTER